MVEQTSKLPVIIILIFSIFAAFTISGFSALAPDAQIDRALPPNVGGADDETDIDPDGAEPEPGQVNLIKNGGFEQRDPNGVALDWQPYSNGQAQFGWYDETWPEAVQAGEHAQLMEIFMVEGDLFDQVIAVYQTVDVTPNVAYQLTMHALIRTDIPAQFRNKFEYEMNWGVDFSGAGNYDNVEEWVFMPLTEQFRLGSHGEYPEDVPLFYETITGTIQAGDSHRITLFIRGLKKFPTGAEVNFDIDQVSLVGLSPQVSAKPALAASTETTPTQMTGMPDTGLVLPKNISIGALVMGGLLLIVLGTYATASLLQNKKEP